jgi:hypothetical protein
VKKDFVKNEWWKRFDDVGKETMADRTEEERLPTDAWV